MRPRPSLAPLLAALACPATARAADFHVDPASGSMDNDGSAAKPWSTLAEVVAAKKIASQNWDKLPYKDGAALVPRDASAPVKAGDTIWLHSGFHGDVSIRGYYNEAGITVAAAPGQTPRLGHLEVAAAQNWVFRGLSLSPSFAPDYVPTKAMVSLLSPGYEGPVRDITVEDCSLESVPDTSKWTGEQWLTLPADGLDVRGTRQTIRNNRLHNVRFGISVSATDSLVERNVIDSFGNGDGLRGLGDRSTFQYNVVKNAHHPDPDAGKGNHDDGFQSWSLGVDPADGKTKPGFGVVKGIVLRGNLFLNDERLDEPYFSKMQGIGCFDGMFEDFVIENNVVISSTYHGISLYGATNCRIVNNTVINRADDKLVPWIRVYDHKDGTPSTGNVIRNNLSSALGDQSKGVVSDHNLLIKDPSALFVSVATFDLHLLPGSPAIDQGSADQAPALDADGVPRPQGKAVDLGAFEWHDGPIAGSGGAGSGGAPAAGAAGQGGAGSPAAGTTGGPPAGAAGAKGGQGGAGQGGAVSGSSGQAGAAGGEGDDSGCGCRAAGGAGAPTASALGALGLLAAGWRRRGRRG